MLGGVLQYDCQNFVQWQNRTEWVSFIPANFQQIEPLPDFSKHLITLEVLVKGSIPLHDLDLATSIIPYSLLYLGSFHMYIWTFVCDPCPSLIFSFSFCNLWSVPFMGPSDHYAPIYLTSLLCGWKGTPLAEPSPSYICTSSVTTCASGSGSRMWQNPTGDDWCRQDNGPISEPPTETELMARACH